jgi:hypothetical protein
MTPPPSKTNNWSLILDDPKMKPDLVKPSVTFKKSSSCVYCLLCLRIILSPYLKHVKPFSFLDLILKFLSLKKAKKSQVASFSRINQENMLKIVRKIENRVESKKCTYSYDRELRKNLKKASIVSVFSLVIIPIMMLSEYDRIDAIRCMKHGLYNCKNNSGSILKKNVC